MHYYELQNGVHIYIANHVSSAFWLQGLHDKIEYDGLWLDMNEVSNYCSGDVCQDPGMPFRTCLSPRLPFAYSISSMLS